MSTIGSSQCPDQHHLKSLLAGDLNEHDQALCETHIESCDYCQSQLNNLSNNSDSWLKVHALHERTMNNDAPRMVIERIKKRFSLPEASIEFPGPKDTDAPLGRVATYKVQQLIGSGGMGAVYLAVDTNLGHRVAIKVLKPELAANPEHCERFFREGRAAASVKNDNVVAVFNAYHSAEFELPYMVMEYVEGESLSDLLQRCKDSPSERIKLDSRKCAEFIRQAALGLAGAHAKNLVHRDVKPSNLLLEKRTDRIKVADFGLARLVDNKDELVTRHGGAVGTPAYMSPEHILNPGQIDQRSDVFSLGATFYELLTGEKPFVGQGNAVLDQVIREDPKLPRILNERIPAALETICMKCLRKESSDRYQSAAEVANDLSRFQKGEPICARPVSRIEKVWLWCRRNRGWAAAICSFSLGIVATLVMVVFSYQVMAQSARADALSAKRHFLMLQLQGQRLSIHQAGWSNESREMVRSIKKTIPREEIPNLRDEAALIFHGIDAKIIKSFETQPEDITFDSKKHLLITSSTFDIDRKQNCQQAKIWDLANDDLVLLPDSFHDRHGPISFRGDGIPIQAVWGPDSVDRLILKNLRDQSTVQQFVFPPSEQGMPTAMSMTPGGTYVGALVVSSNSNAETLAKILVWRSDTGGLVASIPTKAQDFEICPDGDLVAASNLNGTIEIWSMSQGEQIAKFSSGHSMILCMSWGRDYLVREGGVKKGWLLAAGSHGGDLTIWDIQSKSPRSFCRGSPNNVHRLTFSPDGMSLCSVGRGNPMLWDIATGNLIFKLGLNNHLTAVAYSPDGNYLAVGSRDSFGTLGGLNVWQLEKSRGALTLRGLRAGVDNTAQSPSKRYIAAMADNFQLAVWDRDSQQLMHVFETPQAVFAGNSSFVFDRDEKRIAFSGGEFAMLWSLETGEQLKSVKLPPGFLDRIVFDNSGRLVSVRQESLDSVSRPFGPNDPNQTPRACRVRDLLSNDPKKILFEIRDFPLNAMTIRLVPDGKRVIIEGIEITSKPYTRAIKMFDTTTGIEQWAERSQFTRDAYRTSPLDSSGKYVLLGTDADSSNDLIEVESGKHIRQFDPAVSFISANRQMWIRFGADNLDERDKASLFLDGKESALLTLATTEARTNSFAFSSDSEIITWGNEDGTTIAFDIQAVQRELADLGLGW
jgi:serine/threonine protein kinase